MFAPIIVVGQNLHASAFDARTANALEDAEDARTNLVDMCAAGVVTTRSRTFEMRST